MIPEGYTIFAKPIEGYPTSEYIGIIDRADLAKNYGQVYPDEREFANKQHPQALILRVPGEFKALRFVIEDQKSIDALLRKYGQELPCDLERETINLLLQSVEVIGWK